MQTLPYCGAPPVPGAVSWNLDPILIGVLAAVAVLYAFSAGRENFSPNQRVAFLCGWSVLSLSLVSPLCNLSVALFSARLGQHMLIEFLAAPLIAVGFPWSLSRRSGSLGNALLGALPFAVALWAWHLPSPYEWTFRSVSAYWLMHMSLLATAVLLWKVLLDTRQPAASLIASAITTAQMTVLGAVYTFAGRAFFTVHFGTTQVWGFSPLEDQQLGGLIMWIPPGLALTGVAVWTLATLLSEPPTAAANIQTAGDGR